jgi:hypothetical protein
MHRIRRQILDIELPREAGAVALQRQISRLFQDSVLPKLDAIFNQIAPENRHVFIDRLEIDLGDIGASNWEKNFVERCVAQINNEVAAAVAEAGETAPASARIMDPAAHAKWTFFQFLETGLMPWNARGLTLKAMESLIIPMLQNDSGAAGFQSRVHLLLQQQETVLQRLVWQFSPPFADKIVEIGLGLTPGWIGQAVQIVQSQSGQILTPSNRLALLKAIVQIPAPALRAQPPQPYMLAQVLLQAQNAMEEVNASFKALPVPSEPSDRPGPKGASQQDTSDNRGQTKRKKQGLPVDGILVDNAGAVLLAVYLPAFLSELKLVEADQFPDINARFRAVQLIHYLATGQEDPEEPVLPLPKILCGMDLETPVPALTLLSETEKTESTQLLEAVVRNWPALKNTGADGLRAAFLQRNGLLSWSDNRQAWLLQPERLGQDLLLERLPWSFSVVKLPWMNQMIQVEW